MLDNNHYNSKFPQKKKNKRFEDTMDYDTHTKFHLNHTISRL